jgi:hypothetical protein
MGGATASREDEEAKKMEAGSDTVGQKLDAGALFVLQSKGACLLKTRTIFLVSSLVGACQAYAAYQPATISCVSGEPAAAVHCEASDCC